jgi:hypothetical protein
MGSNIPGKYMQAPAAGTYTLMVKDANGCIINTEDQF